MWVSLCWGRETWYRFPNITPFSTVTGFGEFSTTVSASSKGWQFPLDAKVQAGPQQSSLPGGMEGGSCSEEPTPSPGTESGGTCPCQRFPTAASQMGLEISGLARREEVAFPFSRASAVEFWVGWELMGRGQIWEVQSNVASGALYNSEIISTSSKQFFSGAYGGGVSHKSMNPLMRSWAPIPKKWKVKWNC